ncbi:hypothetical protein D043_0617B, partial [Vibrio parahaemolyticus EKP-021]
AGVQIWIMPLVYTFDSSHFWSRLSIF